jgi:hypothetical protein
VPCGLSLKLFSSCLNYWFSATFVEADRICSSFSVTSAIEDADLPCLSDIEERSVFLLKSSDQSRGSRKATKRKPVDMFAASSSDSGTLTLQ